MNRFQIKLCTVGLSLMLAGSFTGCGESGNSTGPSVSEIEKFIQENPDKLAKPEDSPGEASDEFAAGDSAAE